MVIALATIQGSEKESTVSIAALNWAFDQDVKPAGRKFVLVALANFADDRASCFPSQRLIGKMTGQSTRAVRAHIETLEKAGLVSRERRRRADGSWTSDLFKLGVLTQMSVCTEQQQRLPEAESAGGRGWGNQRQTLRKPSEGSAAQDPKEIHQKEDPKHRCSLVGSKGALVDKTPAVLEQRTLRASTERERRFYTREERLAEERARAPMVLGEIFKRIGRQAQR